MNTGALFTRILCMSQHDFGANGVRLTIGWDAPLATFFLKIWTGEDTDDEDAGPAIWLGGYYGEAPSRSRCSSSRDGMSRSAGDAAPAAYHRSARRPGAAPPAGPDRSREIGISR